jgi:hypothetical protein
MGRTIMKLLRLYWLGTRSTQHDKTVSFFNAVLGLPIRHTEKDFTVAGFLVTDLDEAVIDLERADIEIILPVQQGEMGAWLHFRAPDGFIYELSQEW